MNAIVRTCDGPHITPGQHSGLGDRIEQALTAVGVTQDRWREFKGAMGLPKTCNCNARKKWLNQLGEAFGKTARDAVDALWPKPAQSFRLEGGKAIPDDEVNRIEQTQPPQGT